jgi:hypothetical protein
MLTMPAGILEMTFGNIVQIVSKGQLIGESGAKPD